MPRIWLHYAQLLASSRRVTRARRVCDRALMSLPATQHERVWEVYIRFVGQKHVPTDTALRVWRRYVRFDPAAAEDFVELLERRGRPGEAAAQLARCLDTDKFMSVRNRSRHEMWGQLTDLITAHPAEAKEAGLKVDAILRSGIATHGDKGGAGRLWAGLADYYIRSAAFDRARDVFEEALAGVRTVADFSLVFDAYAQFEESMITALLEAQGEDGAAAGANGGGGVGEGEWRLENYGPELDLDLHMARLESLMDRRPELLSDVRLRQNPNNVHEWRKRVKLFEGDGARQVRTYTQAVKTVEPAKAVGQLGALWAEFAKFYEAHGDATNARVVLKKATQVKYRTVDELATVWCEAAELELRQKDYQGALALCRGALRDLAEGIQYPQSALRKNLKLWGFCLDLEESLASFGEVRKAYERVLDLRIATPQIVLNFAAYMEEHKYFEESFKLFERGVALFRYPQVKEIWATYLRKFVARYGGAKLERARDLFEQALAAAPADESRPIYLEYGQLEEKHGLAKHAMGVYRRGARGVAEKDRRGMYEHYIARAADLYGATKTREIYEEAIESDLLTEADVRQLCRRYAQLEKSLGEIDRARAIFVSAASLADPSGGAEFWADWNAFEVAHGNEETFREMLRIKRSVSTAYASTAVMTAPTPADAAKGAAGASALAPAAATQAATAPSGGDAMAALEAAGGGGGRGATGGLGSSALGGGTGLSGFVSAGVVQQKPPEAAQGAQQQAGNDEEIDLGDDDDAGAAPAAPPANEEELDLDAALDDDEGEQGGAADASAAPTQLPVPAAVFGGLQPRTVGAKSAPMGALERMKKKQRHE